MMTIAKRVGGRNKLYFGGRATILYGGHSGKREGGPLCAPPLWEPRGGTVPLVLNVRGEAQESAATSGHPIPTRTLTSKPIETSVSNYQGRGFRPLSDVEYKDRRLRGLCFTCDEKYTAEHVYRNKAFLANGVGGGRGA